MFFNKKNKFTFGLIKFFIFGVFLFGGFLIFNDNVLALPVSCQCEEAEPGCVTVDLSTDQYNSDNRDNIARTACDIEAGCTAVSFNVGLCPGFIAYACDNCYNSDGSCALLYTNSEINAREKCWRQVPGCASFGQANVTVVPITCSAKTFIYQTLDDNGRCACYEVWANDLKGAETEAPNVAFPMSAAVTSCDASNKPEARRIGSCAGGGVRKINDYHCYRVDDDACMPISSENENDAYEQAKNLCKSNTTSSKKTPLWAPGKCPTGISTGKSADALLAEAAGSLNPAHISQPTDLIGKAIKMLMAFIGSISLVLYVYAGILWLSASGAPDRVDKAKKVIVWTTLGVVVMLISYLLVNFVFKSLGL